MGDSRNLPPAGDVSVVTDDLAINEDEREEIEHEIDTLVNESGRESSLPPEYLRPRRSGFGLPVLIWVLAGAAFAAGFTFISTYFQVREESIALESRDYFTTEAQLIEEILRESAQRLAAKDEEIGEIQDRLVRLDAEKANLEENLEAEVAEREAELRAALEAELQAERERLAEAGQSEEEIEARLQEIETDREAEVAAQIDAFRAQAREEVDELQAQLETQEAQLQQTLEASREERERLAEEAAQREAELRAEFTEEIEELEEAERAALGRIEELQELREEEQLLTDRVLGSFAVIVEDIEEGLTEEALDGLASLERLLLGEGVGSGDRRQRRETELALVSTLRGLVREVDVLRQNIAVRDLTTTEEETEQIEQERAVQLIETAAETVELAEAAREEGRFSEARSLYQQALATIPSLEKVYPGILDLESTRREVALRSAIGEAQSLLAAGSNQQAVNRYLEAMRTIAADEDDPLLDVASGVDAALAETREDLLSAQDELRETLDEQISSRDEQIASLTRNLNAARNTVATTEAAIRTLRDELAATEDQLATQRRLATQRASELASLRRELDGAEDEVASLQTSLAAARSRSTSLEASLESAQERADELETDVDRLEEQLANARSASSEAETRVASLENALEQEREVSDELESEVASLEQELAERPERAADPSDVPAATQEELDRLNGTIAEREAQVEQLSASLEESEQALADARARLEQASSTGANRDERVAELEARLEEARTELSEGRAATDGLEADLEEASAQIASLEERVASLQESRSATSVEAEQLQQEVDALRSRVAELEALEADIESLAADYERALAVAQRRVESGAYALARTALVGPFASEEAGRYFPGFPATLETAHEGVVAEAEEEARATIRGETIDSVIDLATEVQQNIGAPRESIAVQSYVRREPELRGVADELFEIVELSARAISAPEVEYRLLGSVSRVTGNLVVVERLVTIDAEVGDTAEIRRTPSLGQEVPIGTATILEIAERRVVVSVDEIYEIDTQPAARDLVYLAQE
ncbi:MAG: hypothetical protein ACOCVO_01860 [bacterium]